MTETLAGTQIEYRYEDGGAVVLAVGQSDLHFEWVSGPFAGVVRQGLSYQSRPLGSDAFLVNWHDTEAGSFVTLLVDLPASRVFGSAIIQYRDDNPVTLFDQASITQVSNMDL